MSVVLIAVTAAVAASLGYLVTRRREPSSELSALPQNGEPKRPRTQSKRPAADPLEGLGLALGDVVSAEGQERWLEGAIVAREKSLVGAVFFASEGLSQHAVAILTARGREILWLAPVEVASPAEPPAVLDFDGTIMQRRGRLPVTFERLGRGAPSIGPTGLVATYEAGGHEVALVLTSEGKTLAFSGRRLEEGEYDRMGRVSMDE